MRLIRLRKRLRDENLVSFDCFLLMTRNWEIIRRILIRLEESSTPNTVVRAREFPEFTEQEVAYNMRLLNEDGYIVAKYEESKSRDRQIRDALASRLTPRGHDLLDTIKNDSIWNKIKEKFKSKAIDMTPDLVLTVGKVILETTLAS